MYASILELPQEPHIVVYEEVVKKSRSMVLLELYIRRSPEPLGEFPAPQSMQRRTVWFAVPVQLMLKVEVE